jgi:hypothetical protein
MNIKLILINHKNRYNFYLYDKNNKLKQICKIKQLKTTFVVISRKNFFYLEQILLMLVNFFIFF